MIGAIKLTKMEPNLYATVRIHLGGMCGAVAEALVIPQQESTLLDGK